jgi:hypothetical protein
VGLPSQQVGDEWISELTEQGFSVVHIGVYSFVRFAENGFRITFDGHEMDFLEVYRSKSGERFLIAMSNRLGASSGFEKLVFQKVRSKDASQ